MNDNGATKHGGASQEGFNLTELGVNIDGCDEFFDPWLALGTTIATVVRWFI
jgi:hypothetical protein